MQLMGRLGDEEQTAEDEDEIAPGKGFAPQSEDRGGEPEQRGEPKQQRDPEDERQRQAEAARGFATPPLKARDQDRDEYDIIDAEHDFERRKARQRRPGIKAGHKLPHGSRRNDQDSVEYPPVGEGGKFMRPSTEDGNAMAAWIAAGLGGSPEWLGTSILNIIAGTSQVRFELREAKNPKHNAFRRSLAATFSQGRWPRLFPPLLCSKRIKLHTITRRCQPVHFIEDARRHICRSRATR